MLLYVHIPFCRAKCRYCSFCSFPWEETAARKNVRLILHEAEKSADWFRETIETVYFGGGTPSLLPPDLLRSLVSGLGRVFTMDHVCEWTSEANPGTVTDQWLETAAEAGINRISFGVQAFQPHLLKTLGRIHFFEQAEASVRMARRHGFRNVNLDLIFGIPGQTPEDWKETLDAALSLSPEHISAYGLIPEEGTPLYQALSDGSLILPDPETEREMYDEAIRRLALYGLKQYEISNFAREGFECRHNIGYWTQKPYLGLGVSAASMRILRTGAEGMVCLRKNNPSTLTKYENAVLSEKEGTWETVSVNESRFETMMLGLRMNCGVSEEDFRHLHGVPLSVCYGRKLAEMEKNGLVISEGRRWRLTRRGMDVQNAVLVELMD